MQTQFITPAFWLPKNTDIWEKHANLAVKLSYGTGETIVHIGEQLNGLMYLHKGRAKGVFFSTEGNEKLLYYVNEGSMFAEGPALATAIPTTCFISITPCVVYKFSKSLVMSSLLEDPEVVRDLLHSLALKICMLSQHIQGNTTLNLENYVCRALYWLLVRNGCDTTSVRPAMTQQEVANMLGVHRTTLTRLLGRLRERGVLLAFTKRRLEVSDLAELRRYAALDPDQGCAAP